jgi:hypothetical protein
MSALAPPCAQDLERGLIEIWDFIERGDGRRDRAAALAGGDAPPDDPSS